MYRLLLRSDVAHNAFYQAEATSPYRNYKLLPYNVNAGGEWKWRKPRYRPLQGQPATRAAAFDEAAPSLLASSQIIFLVQLNPKGGRFCSAAEATSCTSLRDQSTLLQSALPGEGPLSGFCGFLPLSCGGKEVT